MQVSKILITNNIGAGNHPADKWAMATAETIAEASQLDGDRLLEAQKLQLKIAEILKDHHAQAQSDEQAALAADPAHVHTSFLDVLKVDIANVVAAIVEAAKGSLWEAHFAQPGMQEYIKQIVENHFASSMHVERLAHTDRNPDCPHAQAYRAAHFGGAN